MTSSAKDPRHRVSQIALVSTPWPLYDRPSVQLGTLKAYLKTRFPTLKVQALHLYLKIAKAIGFETYRAISKRTWLAESVYAALLFPEKRAQTEKVFYREANKEPGLRKVDFTTLCARVEEASQILVQDFDWQQNDLVGFSICLCQLTSSLFFIKTIKKAFPNLRIVVGGSMFSGNHAHGLMKCFRDVDFVINGEGERPLSSLIRFLQSPTKGHNIPVPLPGVLARNAVPTEPVGLNQMAHLNSLPPPDYDDYFTVLKTFEPDKAFFPTLPAEISRGCWWRSRRLGSQDSGCAFCNLNLQWDGYRSKTLHQVIGEIEHLTGKYQTLSVAFTDNLLPARHCEKIFQELSKLGKDLRLFAEIRATTPRHVLKAMKAAGTEEVQIGIEALSTSLLAKLRKGTTAIQNLQIMKYCEELGIASRSNLILCFPGSDAQDVKQTLNTIEFALPFQPLRCVSFWLGLGSPGWQHPQSFGLKAISNHSNYKALFPFHIYQAMDLMIQSYRGNLGYQKKLWQPVKTKANAWKKAYHSLHNSNHCCPALSFRDGRDFIIIRQKRPEAETLTHRLVGTSRAIYLFCLRHRSLKSIVKRFPKVGYDRVMPFLKMMVDKRLMYEENGRYLSLAVRVR